MANQSISDLYTANPIVTPGDNDLIEIGGVASGAVKFSDLKTALLKWGGLSGTLSDQSDLQTALNSIILRWTFSAADDSIPSTGQFTTDSTNAGTITHINLRDDMGGGFSTLDLLVHLPINSRILLVGISEFNVFTLSSATSQGGGTYAQLTVNSGTGNNLTIGKTYQVSIIPQAMTAVDVGLGNVTNDAQVKVTDIGTTVLAPNGDGANLSNVAKPADITLDAIETAASITPMADGTYTVGIGGTTNGTITISKGIITDITQAV